MDNLYNTPYSVYSHRFRLMGPYSLKQASEEAAAFCRRHPYEWFWLVRMDEDDVLNSKFVLGYMYDAEKETTEKTREILPSVDAY